MASQSSVNKTILANGIRILSERVLYVDSVSVGIWAQAGSRDETDERMGMSHFLEHMMFKGTAKRSARKIADDMDSLGGHLNAFTDKEFTCYYAKVLKEHLPAALDIISDMVLNSVFDPIEIEREKNVVIEEINRHIDTPEDHVHDLLAETLWKGHRLGNSVIGSSEVIQSVTQESFISYVQEFYRPDALVISGAGNVEHKDFVDMVASAFGRLEGKRPPRIPIDAKAQLTTKLVDKITEQVHFVLGTDGFAQDRKEKYALAAIDSVLGGGMSSRLFQEIRENRGLAYAIGSYSASYQEAGMFAVYGGTSVQNIKYVLELTQAECQKIQKESVTDAELERAKNQIRGALVLGQESMSNRMSRLAKSELYFGRIVRLDDIIDAITNVSRDDVANVASQLFKDSKFAVAAIGPFKEHADLLGDTLVLHENS
ncbi:MAG: pitrilysin family protein [Armatimonadetes bacterium]|nr:pitrilysin family protein [Armatimonadota bacterium]